MTLSEMKAAHEAARDIFLNKITSKFPGFSEWHWYRALSAVRGENRRRNDDQSNDIALAADAAIRQAHDDYIRLLHKFYLKRDGPNGVLGGRGL